MEPVNPAYAAPRASEAALAVPAEARLTLLAMRIAGGYLGAAALAKLIPWSIYTAPRLFQNIPDPLYALPAVLPVAIPTLLQILMAVPLLLGNGRFRVATVVVTSIWAVLGIAMAAFSAAMVERYRPGNAWTMVPTMVALSLLHWAIVMLLLTGRASRARLGLALGGIGLHLAGWVVSALR
jgi:hypothetical protein